MLAMRAALLLSASLLLLTGCDDDHFGPEDDWFEGYYQYAGTVEDAAGDVVAGSVWIDRQRRGTAEVSIDWEYFDRGLSVVRIRSDQPAIADIDGDDRIEFEFQGDLFLDGEVAFFRLIHVGRLHGRTLTGDWWLETDLPTDDRGSFTARRD
jgi:hypothetical protein